MGSSADNAVLVAKPGQEPDPQFYGGRGRIVRKTGPQADWAALDKKIRASHEEQLNLSHAELYEFARQVRKDAVLMTHSAQSGHTGGPFSMADYMAPLLCNYLRLKPREPFWEDRDRFLVSNGHTSAGIYSLLCRRGYFSPGYLLTFRSTPSRLQGHPNHIKLPGIEIGTGSLGQGLSAAHGMALAQGLDGPGAQHRRTVCNVGDGEMQEGQIWECIHHAGHRGTDNFIMSVDYNDIQIDGYVREVKRLDPLADKLRAFHWEVREVDGHDMGEICAAWEWAWERKGSPSALIFKTVMMHGVPEYEYLFKWHGQACNDEQALHCLKALGFDYASLDEAKTEYGERVYDGVVPKVLAAPWARVLHMDTLRITAGEHNAGH
jgi:transketolase